MSKPQSAQKTVVVIGTRGSPLALWQANHIKELLCEEFADLEVRVKPIKTTGDKIRDMPLARVGGKSLFIKEIEEALLSGEVDIAVHSMKDVPTELPQELTIAAVTQRDDPRDVFLSKKYKSLLEMPKRATLGTSSLRRLAQMKNFRPDLVIVPLRGNVDTRLRKMKREEVQGILLAAAGLNRLGLSDQIAEYLSPTMMVPAVGQGAVGVEARRDDKATMSLLGLINHIETYQGVLAERSFLRELEGGCQVPIGGYAEVSGSHLKIIGMVASYDGRTVLRDQVEGNPRDAETLGKNLAQLLIGQGAREILKEAAAAFEREHGA